MNATLVAMAETVGVLVPIVNPPGVAPAFVALSANRPQDERRALLRRVVLTVGAVLIVFAIAGEQLLHAFGISIEALQIAGGLVVGYAGFRMVTATEAFLAPPPADGTDPALTPLAIPLLAGPGAMAALLGLESRTASFAEALPGIVAGILVICGLTWLTLAAGERVTRRLGRGGIVALTLVFGLITLAIAVEMIVHGILTHGAVVAFAGHGAG